MTGIVENRRDVSGLVRHVLAAKSTQKYTGSVSDDCDISGAAGMYIHVPCVRCAFSLFLCSLLWW